MGGITNAIMPQQIAPTVFMKTAKSGMIRAITVMSTMTEVRIATTLNFLRGPSLKTGLYSMTSNAARI